MKLYYLNGACSMVPHTALEWVGKPYEAESASREFIKSPEYLALNPQGSVPLLVDGDFALSQNMAILYYLDQLHPEAKLFGSGDAQSRALAVRWLSFANSDLHKTFSPLFHAPSTLDEAGKAALQESLRQNILRMYQQVETQLTGRDYVTGDEITIADVYIYVTMRWARALGLDLSGFPNLATFYQRVSANAGVEAVRHAEGLPV